jgi:hypothetical protein
MTKVEWATWLQVGVGALAVLGAVRAVRAAHELALSAKREEWRMQNRHKFLEGVGGDYVRLLTLHKEFETIAGTLRSSGDFTNVSLLNLRAMVPPVLSKDYAGSDALPLVPTFIDIQHQVRAAWEALGHMQELHRRRIDTHTKFPAYLKAVERFGQLLPEIEKFVMRRLNEE